MSDQKQNKGPGWGTVLAVGAGLGAAAAVAYALMETHHSISRICNKCSEVIHDDSEEIQLLCNHLFHKRCLLMAYQLHTSNNVSGDPFTCLKCYFRIPPSVIRKLSDQRALPGPPSSSLSLDSISTQMKSAKYVKDP